MKSASLFLLALVLCSCAMAQDVTQQEANRHTTTNGIRYVTTDQLREEAERRVDAVVAAEKTNAYYRPLTAGQNDFAAVMLRNFRPPRPWPESLLKSGILDSCAKDLRSAVGTNELDQLVKKMTLDKHLAKQQEVFKEFMKQAMSSLDELAVVLTSSNLITEVRQEEGYFAGATNLNVRFDFYFWANKSGPIRLRQVEERLPNHFRIMAVLFHEDGRLRSLRFNRLVKKDGQDRVQSSGFSFLEDGKLQGVWLDPDLEKP